MSGSFGQGGNALGLAGGNGNTGAGGGLSLGGTGELQPTESEI
jgi:hypothetical protein